MRDLNCSEENGGAIGLNDDLLNEEFGRIVRIARRHVPKRDIMFADRSSRENCVCSENIDFIFKSLHFIKSKYSQTDTRQQSVNGRMESWLKCS